MKEIIELAKSGGIRSIIFTIGSISIIMLAATVLESKDS